ncbi:MAG TPA: SpoIIE family protein phosphatase [Nocardioidaceae bacterium]|nr:SpoIIE family protein phosphatase [Nocardioidaceae bacterium]
MSVGVSRERGGPHVVEHTLQLSNAPDAVPAARRFVREQLHGTALEHRADDCELILSELVTNATLHGRPPVTVGVQISADRARLEVADTSAGTPVRPVHGPEAMTGRGLMLVDALSERWGLDRRPRGKLVWAEVGLAESSPKQPARPGPVCDELPEPVAGSLTPSGEPRFRIELGDVPTDLLLAAKAHVDSVIREFVLVSAGAASGQTAAIPGDLARLIDTVTTRFAEARDEIKRQALGSAAAADERTHLVLTLPLSAADAGLEYLHALGEVDAYARAARLLTLETPPQHRAFREWYVTSLVEQLRALGKGEEPPPRVSFEHHLLDELEIVATAHRATDRAARLQQVTASLAGATSLEDVAQVVVAQGVEALGASRGALLVPTNDGHFDVLANVHYGDALLRSLQESGVQASLPSAEALRSMQPVWLESPEQRDLTFPQMRAVEPRTVSLCAVPLVLAGRVLGVLRLSFESPHLFDEEERAFVLAFTAQTVQALDRADLYTLERRARADAETAVGRLSRLNQITAALAGASDVQQIGAIVAEEAHRTLGAQMSALCVLDSPDTLLTVEMEGASPGTLERWTTFPVAANLPASEVVRTRQTVVLRSRAEIEERYPALAGESRREHSLVCVPLLVGKRTRGALSLTFPPTYVLDDDVVQLLGAFGHQCALAIERAHLVSAERTARNRASFLADSTARVASSLDPDDTLANLTDLVVPELADWCAVYLANESGRVGAATAKHRDGELTLLMRRLQREHPLDTGKAGDIAEVLQTGRRVCYPEASAQRQDQLCALFGGGERAEPLRPRSVIAVPFVRRESLLGAMVLARVDGPAYSDDELMLATELADRAAVALDNAARFRHEREVALTLQRSLLPQVLPRVPGLALAWRYFPGAEGTNIGGDWYDVIPLEDGRVALIIGDVMGRGLQAAAVMGQLRATARAHVYAGLGPAEALARIDTELMRLEQDQIATVLLGILDSGSGRFTMTSAGHLPPLVRAPGGEVSYLDVPPGPPLGTGSNGYTEVEVTLAAGATVLLYTDGLVEDRWLPIDQGMATLAAAARASREPELLCDRALVALGRDTEHDDDTAMLAVHFAPGSKGSRPGSRSAQDGRNVRTGDRPLLALVDSRETTRNE